MQIKKAWHIYVYLKEVEGYTEITEKWCTVYPNNC
jgi:hypothetical protein